MLLALGFKVVRAPTEVRRHMRDCVLDKIQHSAFITLCIEENSRNSRTRVTCRVDVTLGRWKLSMPSSYHGIIPSECSSNLAETTKSIFLRMLYSTYYLHACIINYHQSLLTPSRQRLIALFPYIGGVTFCTKLEHYQRRRSPDLTCQKTSGFSHLSLFLWECATKPLRDMLCTNFVCTISMGMILLGKDEP